MRPTTSAGIQQIDQKFKSGNTIKFLRDVPATKLECTKTSSPTIMLFSVLGKSIFEALGKSRRNTDGVMLAADERANTLLSESYHNREDVLDTPFQLEEMGNAIKRRKSADNSGITAEHIRYGGHNL